MKRSKKEELICVFLVGCQALERLWSQERLLLPTCVASDLILFFNISVAGGKECGEKEREED